VSLLDIRGLHYIRSKTNQELVTELKPFWKNLETTSLSPRVELDEYLSVIVNIEKDRLKKLSDIDERTSYYFQRPKLETENIVWKKSDKPTTIKHLEAVQEILAKLETQDLDSPEKIGLLLDKYIIDANTDKGTVLWPIRYALSGLSASPSPFELIYTLTFGYGVSEVVARLKVASELLASQ
jgi:glutamyl-tRNA synthetase